MLGRQNKRMDSGTEISRGRRKTGKDVKGIVATSLW